MKVSQQELKEKPQRPKLCAHISHGDLRHKQHLSRGARSVPVLVPTPVPSASLGIAGPDATSPSLA